MQQSLDTRALETSYEKSCRQVDGVYETEKARRLRLQNLLLGDDCDHLYEQLAHCDDRMDELERHTQALQEDLDASSANLENAKGEVRIKSREIEILKVGRIGVN